MTTVARRAGTGPLGIRDLAAAGLLAAACALVSGDAWTDLLRVAWHDQESGHVFLVPPVIAWLVWLRRRRFRGCAPRGKLLGTFVLAIGWVIWSVGYRRQIQSFWHGGAVLMTAGGALTVLGSEVFFQFVPAFAALLFLVPVPATTRQWIAVPLQHATARVTQMVAELCAMDVQREGSMLITNQRQVAIAEACNGMRMVFTLFLSCYVFAFATALRTSVRLVVLAAAPLIAVACNVLRLVPIVWVYGHADRGLAESFHDASSWAMLVVAFVGMTGIVRLLRWTTIRVSPLTLARG